MRLGYLEWRFGVNLPFFRLFVESGFFFGFFRVRI